LIFTLQPSQVDTRGAGRPEWALPRIGDRVPCTKSSYVKSALCPPEFPRCSFTAAGLRLDTGAHDNLFRYNTVHDLDLADQGSSAGIYSESGCNNNRFERNLIFNIGTHGMVDGSFNTNIATGNQWVNNTVWNVGQVGMLIANARDAVVKNNLIIETGKSAIYVTSKSVKVGGHEIHHNDYVVRDRCFHFQLLVRLS
jgi:hypothetical protein